MNNRKITEENLKETLGSIILSDTSRQRITERLQIKHRVSFFSLKKHVPAVAGALLLVTASLSGIAVYAENAEYNKAVEFFDDYKLSAEGLTRGEIKGVYKDISTGRFTYAKTLEVITRSVGGTEIFQEEPSREDLEALWNYRNGNIYRFVPDSEKPDADGVSFEYSFVENRKDGEAANEVVSWDTIFKKMDDGSEMWSVQLRDFNYSGHIRVGGDTVIYGTNSMLDTNTRILTRVVMIGNDGREKWVFGSPGEFDREDYYHALYEDGALTFFGVGDFDSLICTKLSLSGELISHKTSKQAERFYVDTAAKLGEGYLVLVKNYGESDRILKTDPSGIPVDSFVYDAEDEFYTIQDMAEFGGKVFLSAYAVPKPGVEGGYGGRYEIADILDYIFSEKNMEIGNEELTKLLRDNYTAVLLLCDPQTGVPQEFYSVKGSLGADLRVTDEEPDDISASGSQDRLEWDVESITEAFFSPMTSSFTIGGDCRIYRYTFDTAGGFVSQVKTDETAAYRR